MKNLAFEIWKPIKGYESRYEVSSLGRVRSWVKRGCIGGRLVKTPRLMTLIKNNVGYIHVSLTDDKGIFKRYDVHRLVLLTFVGECPKGCNASHIDETKTNNRLSNLKWASYKENQSMPKRKQRYCKSFPLGKSGYRGVYKNGNGYEAHITINRDKYYLGLFTTAVEAHEAYKKAYKEWYGKDYK